MGRVVVAPALAFASLAVLAPAAIAQAPRVQQTASADAAPMDTAAIGALNRMATYLGSLDAFQVEAEVFTEEVLEDGQKVLMSNKVDVVADRPNRLRVLRASDREQRLFLYNGTDFVMSAPRLKYYARTPAPRTIVELVTMLEDRFDIELPLVDLFRWGQVESAFRGITSARVIGPSEVRGVTTDHLAFRQDGLDWQIWIQKGAFPLPRRIVLTTMTDEARPQHTSTYTWNLAPSFNDDAFAFTAPEDFKQIQFEEVKPIGVAASN